MGEGILATKLLLRMDTLDAIRNQDRGAAGHKSCPEVKGKRYGAVPALLSPLGGIVYTLIIHFPFQLPTKTGIQCQLPSETGCEIPEMLLMY